MVSRFRTALGLTLLLTLLTSVTVFAKGSFAFITIKGLDLEDPVRATDPALTTDFFAFANFYQNQGNAPADPGVGYEITRYYVDGSRETAFDRLHYYPETGYVFYDGLVNGSSEYDKKWYPAKPEFKDVFLTVLSLVATGKADPQTSISRSQVVQPDPTSVSASQFAGIKPVLLISLIVGMAVVAAFGIWRHWSLVSKKPF